MPVITRSFLYREGRGHLQGRMASIQSIYLGWQESQAYSKHMHTSIRKLSVDSSYLCVMPCFGLLYYPLDHSEPPN